MAWAYGRNSAGREVGYSIHALCDHTDCNERIDRGLDFVCGGEVDGGGIGCGDYFCYDHLFAGIRRQLCLQCFYEFYQAKERKDL